MVDILPSIGCQKRGKLRLKRNWNQMISFEFLGTAIYDSLILKYFVQQPTYFLFRLNYFELDFLLLNYLSPADTKRWWCVKGHIISKISSTEVESFHSQVEFLPCILSSSLRKTCANGQPISLPKVDCQHWYLNQSTHLDRRSFSQSDSPFLLKLFSEC